MRELLLIGVIGLGFFGIAFVTAKLMQRRVTDSDRFIGGVCAAIALIGLVIASGM